MPMLPSSSSQLERDIESVITEPVGYDISALWNVDECPSEFLAWLAWALSVDVWDAGWSDFTKRQVIRNSIELHRLKGSVASVSSALQPFGALVTMTEWFDQSPPGDPMTFRLDVVVEGGFSAEVTERIINSVDQVKPVSRSYTLNAGVGTSSTSYVGAGVYVMGYQHSRIEAVN